VLLTFHSSITVLPVLANVGALFPIQLTATEVHVTEYTLAFIIKVML
jgi:hypothetical protein